MKNNKAFTLIELIATIIIIALIFLVVFPSVYKLMRNNTKTEYENYYNIAKKAAYVYADTQKDSLGGSIGSGCIGGEDNEITIDDLIDMGFLKPFNDKDISYSGNVVIRNNYGKITVKLYMNIDNNKFGETDTDECLAYNPESDNALTDVLQAKNNLESDSGEDQYISGTNPNNYVWYSGKLWRAIQIDGKSQDVKLVTNDVISVIPFDEDSNVFNGSYIASWLNNYFFNTLYNPKKYISTHSWQYSTNLYANKKVGLVSYNDLLALRNDSNITYLNGEQWHWTLTKGSTNNVKVVETSTLVSDCLLDDPSGVRPAIYIKSGIKVLEGSGTKTLPYQLEGNKIQDQKGKALNTRYSGEFVKIDNNLYRIVNIENDKTKLVSVNTITLSGMTTEEIKTSKTMSNTIYTLSNIYKYLNTTWYDALPTLIKQKIVIGDWCLIDSTKALNINECGTNNKDIKSFKIGLPKYGEIFSSYIGTDNKSFWTLTPIKDTTQMIIINPDGAISNRDVNYSDNIKVSFYLDSSVKIKSGAGSESNPFIL